MHTANAVEPMCCQPVRVGVKSQRIEIDRTGIGMSRIGRTATPSAGKWLKVD